MTRIIMMFIIGGGESYMAEHGNWPIFLTEFGKIVDILADFGKQEIIEYGNFVF